MWCKGKIPAYAGMTWVGAGVGERRDANVAVVGRGRLAGAGFLVVGARSVDVW